MNGLKDLRVAGLGLAAAMTSARPTGPRVAVDLAAEGAAASFAPRRLFDVFRRADGATVAPAGAGRAAATPSSRPLARIR
jgi:hypothetical protein